jgi:hypothetical protein
MKRILLNIPILTWGALLLFVAAIGYSHAQVVPQPGPPTPIACAYNTTPVTLTDGQAGWVQCNSSGAILTSGGAGTQAVTVSPSSASTAAGTNATSTAAESNRVIKASAGNLYNITITIGATSGYLMLFDATSAPSDGAVTPTYCIPVVSNGTNGFASAEWAMPKRFGTGITAVFSTAGCFSKTASATAAFFAGYQ